MHSSNNPKERSRNRKDGGGRGDRPKVPFGGFRFIRIELTETERDELRSVLEDGSTLPFDLDNLVRDGYTLKISCSDGDATVLASLSQCYRDHQNAGLVLTARGRNTATALSVLSYKLHTLIREDPWRQVEAERGGPYEDGIG